MNLPYDACKILFLPDTPKGTLKVQSGRGVAFQHHWYWCDEMLQPKVEGSDIEAKYDPYDLTRIHLYIGDTWVEAEVRSGPLREILHLLTEWERKYVSQELTGLARKYRGSKQQKKVSAAYGAFVRELRSTEEGKRAALKSQANQANQLTRRAASSAPDEAPQAKLLPAVEAKSSIRVDRAAIKSAPIIKNK
jgi:hypothetical protein